MKRFFIQILKRQALQVHSRRQNLQSDYLTYPKYYTPI